MRQRGRIAVLIITLLTATVTTTGREAVAASGAVSYEGDELSSGQRHQIERLVPAPQGSEGSKGRLITSHGGVVVVTDFVSAPDESHVWMHAIAEADLFKEGARPTRVVHSHAFPVGDRVETKVVGANGVTLVERSEPRQDAARDCTSECVFAGAAAVAPHAFSAWSSRQTRLVRLPACCSP